MSSIVNTLAGTGGLIPLIIVTAPTGSTVTCDGVAGTEVSGTWTFNVILGTHTIVASKDGNTVTKSVNVDTVAIYPVAIVYAPSGAVYWLGDEFDSKTGGWNNTIGTNIITKYDTYMQTSNSTSGGWGGRTISQVVSFSGYSTIYIEYEITYVSSDGFELAIYSAVPASWDAGQVKSWEPNRSSIGTFTASWSITSYQSTYAVGVKMTTNFAKVKKIWLE